jgi:hypothetical protein
MRVSRAADMCRNTASPALFLSGGVVIFVRFPKDGHRRQHFGRNCHTGEAPWEPRNNRNRTYRAVEYVATNKPASFIAGKQANGTGRRPPAMRAALQGR